MYKIFAILLLSFIFTAALAIPFIHALYKLHIRQKPVKSVDMHGNKTVFNDLHGWKVGTPTGGGVLILGSVLLFSIIFYVVTSFSINWTSIILFVTLISFGVLGMYDDFRKMIRVRKRRIRALPALEKLIIQTILGLIIGYLLYKFTGLHTVEIPILSSVFRVNDISLGWLYIPFAAFVIVSSSNAFNITDGMDGLATGLMLIALSAFWVLAVPHTFSGDVILFIAVLMGALLAFLYFNVYPARLFMGDSGSIAFGALLGVIALLIGKSLVLPIIGGVFVIELLSSLIQLFSIRYLGEKRLFKIAPLHHHFEAMGWDETKVTMRFWIAGALCAFIGLFIATI
ncbi:phospho-N-acetylmuramoyl-pentapeptide-transferase [bacterium]|uniref:Phospho-N-acetylmuramoyl-pentapeptide-transferase n=2 Tax=Katanobacteria TaxID=422282 RepID=A0A2M7X545_UNCKA|nr:phospho-N-acetylmuramoyl-pentapeptide-transferase [bacterium]PIP56388.1 MAG: phospho-N-acetylmuramoyl-pentapeptide-transferase [candidate division WWE3 bacterium CG22_combo_CG10-13_8_21_14_all_39_12]PJA41282.1 MAG: phospho-N-acetylmuramoyl-pentapeptide-transferase [candidate division WWE3 bacterium CG_4_9_14_3_um_filter_39_7]